MQDKFYKWNLTILIVAVSFLSVLFIQQHVLANWQNPSGLPGDEGNLNQPLVQEPDGDVDVEDNDIINVNTLYVDTLYATTSIEVDDLTVNNSVDITANSGSLDVTVTDSAIDITGPSGTGVAGTFNAGEMGVGAGSSSGVYATTDVASGGYDSYALYGVSNNTGGVAVFGVSNSGYAGYFYGPVGISGAVALGDGSFTNSTYAFAAGHHSLADGDYSLALGGEYAWTSSTNSIAIGNTVTTDGDYATAMGRNVKVTGTSSFGIGLSDSAVSTIAGDNVLAIVGGDVGIGIDPSYKFHLVGDYYQDGMMQVQPTTALTSGENLIYGNAISGSASGSHLLHLQYNGTDKFRVTRDGAGAFSSSLTAGLGNFSNGLEVTGVGAEASFNVPIYINDSNQYKGGSHATFNQSSGSYFDFNDDSDLSAPSCAAGSEGMVYYFTGNTTLCVCDGKNGWKSLVNGDSDLLCKA